jgi:lipoteichoic acid synthase
MCKHLAIIRFIKTHIKTFGKRLIDEHKDRKTYIILAAVVFILLYAYKVSLYTNFLMPEPNKGIFIYKFLVTILWSSIFYSLIFRIRNRVFFIILYILQQIYIVANLLYYMYFHNYFHLTQLFSLFNEGVVASSHLSIPITPKLLIILIDLPVSLYLIIKYKTLQKRIKELKIAKRVLITTSLISIICVEIVNYQLGKSIIQMVANHAGSESMTVQEYGTMVNDVASLINQKSATDFVYGREIINEKESNQKPDIIAIQIESMDANIVNQQYKDQYVMPYLHSLTDTNIYYPFNMSYHMGGGTSDCEFSVINSIQPFPDFPAIKLSNYFYPNSMINKLKEGSYNAVVFHGNNGSFYNRNVAFPKMGFNNYFDFEKMNKPIVGWGVSDADTFNYAENYMKTENDPFIAYVISLTSHVPFDFARAVYSNKRYDDINDATVKNYFNSMSYVDQCLKDFIEKVRNEHKNSYIFIYGDHTPDINTTLYHQASFTMDGKYFEFVPLFILTPDNKKYKENKAVASFLDISPTILNASAIKFVLKSDGMNLLDRNSTLNTIPYNGSNYDRIVLFNKMAETNKESGVSK